MAKKRVFMAFPHSGQANVEALLACFHHASADPDLHVLFPSKSPPGSHCENFNRLWCMALNSRERDGWTHFCMIHSDVEPERHWLDLLLAEMDRTGADVLSVVLPIKDMRGLTSTSVIDPRTMWNQRVTMRELERLPETFTGNDAADLRAANGQSIWESKDYRPNRLLISSGLWVCKFRGDWQPHVWFEMRDRIARLPDGRFVAFNFSEDWNFSLQCHEWGLKLMSTKKIQAYHLGGFDYDNAKPWGKWRVDEDASYGEWLRDLPGMRSKE